MRNAVIDLLFIRIGFSIGLADTLGDNFLIASFVTGVLAVCALHTSRVFQKVAAKSTTHNVVEGLRGELVAVLLNNVFFLLPHGTFTSKTYGLKFFPLFSLLDKAER